MQVFFSCSTVTTGTGKESFPIDVSLDMAKHLIEAKTISACGTEYPSYRHTSMEKHESEIGNAAMVQFICIATSTQQKDVR